MFEDPEDKYVLSLLRVYARMSRGILNTRSRFHSEDVVNSVLGNFIFPGVLLVTYFSLPSSSSTTFSFLACYFNCQCHDTFLESLSFPFFFFLISEIPPPDIPALYSRYSCNFLSFFFFLFLSLYRLSFPRRSLFFLLTPLRYLYRYNFSSSRSSRFPSR